MEKQTQKTKRLSWLSHYFLTGLFFLVPLGFTLFMVVWLVWSLDQMFGGWFHALLGFRIPGLGILLTAAIFVVVGMLLSTNLMAQKVFAYFDELVLRVPGVRAVYKTVKALTDAFSPENRAALKGVALVEYPHPGSLSLGFITGRVLLARQGVPEEKHLSVYVPSNHLYIGNTVLFPESKVIVTGLSVQEGVQIVLSSGAGFPPRLAPRKDLPL